MAWALGLSVFGRWGAGQFYSTLTTFHVYSYFLLRIFLTNIPFPPLAPQPAPCEYGTYL